MTHIRSALSITALLLGLVASAFASGGKANVVLWNAGATLTQTSDTSWKLAKTGAVDPAASSVTWTIDATQGITVGGQVVVNGFIGVSNLGSGSATIGNIVVNLQTRNGYNWVMQASDVADATHGDAATSAHVVAHASSDTLPALNGTTVRQFLGTVNTLLSGAPATYSINDLDPITLDLNAAFDGGVSTFAQDHLVNGQCP